MMHTLLKTAPPPSPSHTHKYACNKTAPSDAHTQMRTEMRHLAVFVQPPFHDVPRADC